MPVSIVPNRELPFAERIAQRSRAISSRLVVGLDPVLDRMPTALSQVDPERALESFAAGVLEVVAHDALAVKVQVAFYERYGWRGWRALQHTVEFAARLGIPVIADAKRGDIGTTAAAYADAFLGDDPATPGPFVDALTINPYLGGDSIAPFLERAIAGRRGLFLLARTSNPGGADFQGRETNGEALYLAVARAATAWQTHALGGTLVGYGPLGLVSGATFPTELRAIRAAAPHSVLLLPGIGAQGAKVTDVLDAFDAAGDGAVAAASRSIIYATATSADWQAPIAAAARAHRLELEDALRRRAETAGKRRG
ncbi:MAG: orotidine-5'-phosphate decarboxylase [Planctomycetota bacterium]